MTSRLVVVSNRVGPVQGAGYAHDGLRFQVAEINGHASVPVVYRGSVPDQFKVGRDVIVDGRYMHGNFVAKRNTLVTKCPSKYAPAKKPT